MPRGKRRPGQSNPNRQQWAMAQSSQPNSDAGMCCSGRRRLAGGVKAGLQPGAIRVRNGIFCRRVPQARVNGIGGRVRQHCQGALTGHRSKSRTAACKQTGDGATEGGHIAYPAAVAMYSCGGLGPRSASSRMVCIFACMMPTREACCIAITECKEA